MNNLLRQLLRQKYKLRNQYRKNEMKMIQLESEQSKLFQQMEALVISMQAYYTETRKSDNVNAQRSRS